MSSSEISNTYDSTAFIKAFNLPSPKEEKDLIIDCFNGITRKEFFNSDLKILNGKTGNVLEGFSPAYNEDLYAFTDLIISIQEANQPFCMVELGAGYGRWLVHAANACKLMNKPLGTLVGCEAEPSHFKWMIQHFKDNNLDPDNHKLVEGIVSNHNGHLPFYIGNAGEWYGQSIAQNVLDYGVTKPEGFLKKIIKKIFGKSINNQNPTPPFKNVPCYTLDSILASLELIDFIHIDIQGAEYDVLSPSIDLLNNKVKKVHIGTHSPDVEPTKGRDMDLLIYNLFTEHQWININRIAPLSTQEKDGHSIHFVDGVQTWVNPRLKDN